MKESTRRREREREKGGKSVQITRARELMTRISEKYLCSRWGAATARTGRFTVQTFTLFPRTHTLIKKHDWRNFLLFRESLNLSTTVEGGARGWGERWRRGWKKKKKEASWRTRKRARQDVHRRSKICGRSRTSYFYVKEGAIFLITIWLNKFSSILHHIWRTYARFIQKFVKFLVSNVDK